MADTIRQLGVRDRIALYNAALDIRKQTGFGKCRIARMLNLQTQTVGQWLYRGTNPNKRNKGFFVTANTTPSADLAYISGAYLGDGYLLKNGNRFGMKVNDLDFLKQFENCIRKIVEPKSYSVYTTNDKKPMHRLNITCYDLNEFLKDEQKIYSLAEQFPSEFIRGFADAEGSVSLCWDTKERKWKRDLRIDNTDKELLLFIKDLALRKFNILFKFQNRNAKLRPRHNKIMYALRLRNQDAFTLYLKFIGFSIKRKQEKLKTIVEKSYGGNNGGMINNVRNDRSNSDSIFRSSGDGVDRQRVRRRIEKSFVEFFPQSEQS